MSFGPASVGYADINLTSVFDDNSTLLVRVAVNAGSKTVDDLVAYLSASGYSQFLVDPEGDYDLSFTINNNFLSDNTMYFGWDFLGFDAGAGVTGLQVTAVPEPTVIWLFSAAGFSILLWRRRNRTLGNRVSSPI